jgi:hypothetical protein
MALTVLLKARTADIVFTPTFLGQQRRFTMIPQYAQVMDVGANLVVQFISQATNLPIDISDADTLQLVIGTPYGTRFTKTATYVTDGTDGNIQYSTVLSDFPVEGVYSIQGIVGFSAGANWHSEVKYVNVLPNIAPSGITPVPDAHVGQFTNSDLVAGVLTIHHYKGLSAPFTVSIIIFDQNGNQITPDLITGFDNYVQVSLASFAPISGLWGWVYI